MDLRYKILRQVPDPDDFKVGHYWSTEDVKRHPRYFEVVGAVKKVGNFRTFNLKEVATKRMPTREPYVDNFVPVKGKYLNGGRILKAEEYSTGFSDFDKRCRVFDENSKSHLDILPLLTDNLDGFGDDSSRFPKWKPGSLVVGTYYGNAFGFWEIVSRRGVCVKLRQRKHKITGSPDPKDFRRMVPLKGFMNGETVDAEIKSDGMSDDGECRIHGTKGSDGRIWDGGSVSTTLQLTEEINMNTDLFEATRVNPNQTKFPEYHPGVILEGSYGSGSNFYQIVERHGLTLFLRQNKHTVSYTDKYNSEGYVKPVPNEFWNTNIIRVRLNATTGKAKIGSGTGLMVLDIWNGENIPFYSD